MNITWTNVKAHVKRNRTRYIVLGGVALGMAIGYSTKRANVNTVAQVAKAAKVTYTLAIENGPSVAVNITPEQASSYNTVLSAVRTAYSKLPEALQSFFLTNGVPEGVNVMVDADASNWSRWLTVLKELDKAFLDKGIKPPTIASMPNLIPLAQ